MSGVFFGWLFLMAAFTTYGWRCRRREGRCLAEGPPDRAVGSRPRVSRAGAGGRPGRRLVRGADASADSSTTPRSDRARPVAARRPPASPAGSPVDRLQRRFLDGEITLPEYESELDALVGRLGRRAFSPAGRRT